MPAYQSESFAGGPATSPDADCGPVFYGLVYHLARLTQQKVQRIRRGPRDRWVLFFAEARAMNSKHRGWAAAITVCIFLFSSSPLRAQTGETFKARLSTSPLPQPMKAMGSGTVTAQLDGHKLLISGTFEGLRAPASLAQIHRGQKAGVRGPVLFNLTVTNTTTGSVNGSIELTAAQIDDLKSGRLYIQIEPEGNVWGWFLR
jgi:hypothetical protein